MFRLSKKSTTVILVIGIITGIFFLKNVLFKKESVESKLVKARSKGDISAPVQIIEYLDLQCPACAYGAKLINEMIEKFPGKIHLRLHYFPLEMHKHAMTASIYAECAALQGKFWEFHDIVLQEQNDWARLANVRPYFFEIAERVELDKTKLDACLVDPSIEERIAAEREVGVQRGIKSTPTYFINDEMVVGGQSLINKLNTILGPGSS